MAREAAQTIRDVAGGVAEIVQQNNAVAAFR
jgi:hypothetical protein